MADIKIGEYIRTEEGYILKNTVAEHKDILDNFEEYIEKFGKIVKHSKDIIDLIEQGDYVNGYRVLGLIRLNNKEISICTYRSAGTMNCEIFKNENIKKVVTKEQFAQVEYRLEE